MHGGFGSAIQRRRSSGTDRSPLVLWTLLICFCLALTAGPFAAAGIAAEQEAEAEATTTTGTQQEEDDFFAAETDSTEAEPATEGGQLQAASEQERDEQQTAVSAAGTSFFTSLKNVPKAGMKANVRQYTYYGELATTVGMSEGAAFSSTGKYSWVEYRKQDKTTQKRNENLNYRSGTALPAILTLTGTWDWSEEKTVNTAGLANTSKRDFQNARLQAIKTGIQTGAFTTTLTGLAALKEQNAVTQKIRNDFTEATLGGGAKTAARLTDGVYASGRAFGQTISGDRSLGETDAPSSASSDTVGLRLRYERRFGSGFVSVTRSNFDEKFLDWKRNANGLIDTTNTLDEDKIAQELRTKNALTLEIENLSRLGPMGMEVRYSHDGDDVDHVASKAGRSERSQDIMQLKGTFAAGRDSFAVIYDYVWKWDDQRIKNATANRGRQYTKERSLDFYWARQLFRSTDLTVKFKKSLSQTIAENQFNANDRDRLRNDFKVEVGRSWDSGFKTDMLFAYKAAEDLSIRSTRSSNNNVKDSYEIAPGFVWPIAKWLSMDQSYRVYIQYTDYEYSYLEAVNKNDNYNKRGNLNTRVSITASDRLKIGVRHDYNKRFNATRTVTDAAGNSFYNTDEQQITSKINFSLRFVVSSALTLEGATYNSLDEKEKYGDETTYSDNRGVEVWLGAKVHRKWGRTNPLELSATIKKFNAYGPGVTETSSDYWEADVWLKWEF